MDSETEGSQWRTHPVPSAAHPNDQVDDQLRKTSGSATVSLQPFGKVRIEKEMIYQEIRKNTVKLTNFDPTYSVRLPCSCSQFCW